MMRTSKRARMETHDFPHDMVIEILSRLSPKSLCRFRCVSKQWRSLTFDPNFMKLHRDKSKKKDPLFIFYDRTPEECQSSLPEGRPGLKETHKLITEDGNGRVCDEFKMSLEGYGDFTHLSSSGHELILLGRKRDIFVCNPSTHDLVKLPTPVGGPDNMSETFLITFIPSTCEYKVLHLCHTPDTDRIWSHRCWIYDIRNDGKADSGCWRLICRSPIFEADEFLKKNHVAHGVFYWWLEIRYDGGEERLVIFSLDVEKEKLLRIKKPRKCSKNFVKTLGLASLKGQLSLMKTEDSDPQTITIDIWILKDQENSLWEKDYIIKFPISLRMKKLACPNCGEREIWIQRDSELFYYNVETKTFHQIKKSREYKMGGLKMFYFGGLFRLGSLPGGNNIAADIPLLLPK